jgi:hypothetical protein
MFFFLAFLTLNVSDVSYGQEISALAAPNDQQQGMLSLPEESATHETEETRIATLVQSLKKLPQPEKDRLGVNLEWDKLDTLEDISAAIKTGSAKASDLLDAWKRRQAELKEAMDTMAKPAEHMSGILDTLRLFEDVMDLMQPADDSVTAEASLGDQGESIPGDPLRRSKLLAMNVEEKLRLIGNLETMLDDIDNARDFYSIGGWSVLLRLMDPSYKQEEEVQAAAAWAIGTAIKNDYDFQLWVLQTVSESKAAVMERNELLKARKESFLHGDSNYNQSAQVDIEAATMAAATAAATAAAAASDEPKCIQLLVHLLTSGSDLTKRRALYAISAAARGNQDVQRALQVVQLLPSAVSFGAERDWEEEATQRLSTASTAVAVEFSSLLRSLVSVNGENGENPVRPVPQRVSATPGSGSVQDSTDGTRTRTRTRTTTTTTTTTTSSSTAAAAFSSSFSSLVSSTDSRDGSASDGHVGDGGTSFRSLIASPSPSPETIRKVWTFASDMAEETHFIFQQVAYLQAQGFGLGADGVETKGKGATESTNAGKSKTWEEEEGEREEEEEEEEEDKKSTSEEREKKIRAGEDRLAVSTVAWGPAAEGALKDLDRNTQRVAYSQLIKLQPLGLSILRDPRWPALAARVAQDLAHWLSSVVLSSVVGSSVSRADSGNNQHNKLNKHNKSVVAAARATLRHTLLFLTAYVELRPVLSISATATATTATAGTASSRPNEDVNSAVLELIDAVKTVITLSEDMPALVELLDDVPELAQQLYSLLTTSPR